MTDQQLAELDAEMSQLSQKELEDERMLMSFQIRFWKQKAWRAEQQRDREISTRKEAEKSLEYYKTIPSDLFDNLVNKIKEEECVKLKNEALSHLGFYKWSIKCSEEKNILDIDTRIKFWTDAILVSKDISLE
uniref:Uncharacterized protein n=1 Tax=viral metagenome TaxID=1070528 RepID=A0A6C0ANM2_9ZZZZ